MLRPDATRVWKNPETKRRLSRYREIIDGNRYAKYMLAKDLPCEFDIGSNLDVLWERHQESNQKFTEYVANVDDGHPRSGTREVSTTFLDLKIEIANRILRNCHFCERRCGADRSLDKEGWCKLGSDSRVSSAFLHTGEEAPLVPSGTIFFASCCLACAFCQNEDISTNPHSGRIVSPAELAAIAETLARDGAININYVGGDPVPNTHTILGSLQFQMTNITQLWNSSMYCSEETMALIADIIDVWLPDFKYGNNECGERLSGVRNYFDIISRNHKMAYSSGEVIIRHLVLPNHIECCTIPILEWVAKNMPNCMINIMAQYRPEHRVRRFPGEFSEINRRVSNDEMQRAFQKADELDICWRPVS